MLLFIKTAIISGVRSRIFFGLVLFSIFLLFIVWLASGFSARHPTTLALDIGISTARLIVILISIYWVQELIAKDIETKTIIFALSYPVPRTSYIVGRFLGISILAFLSMFFVGLIIWIELQFNSLGYEQTTPVALGLPYVLVFLYQWIAVLVIIAFTVMIACLSTIPMLPLMLGLLFALISYAIGPTYDYIIYSDPELFASSKVILEKAFWVLPDLSRLDIRDWTLYGVRPDFQQVFWSTVMSVAYIFSMLLISIIVFKKREFK